MGIHAWWFLHNAGVPGIIDVPGIDDTGNFIQGFFASAAWLDQISSAIESSTTVINSYENTTQVFQQHKSPLAISNAFSVVYREPPVPSSQMQCAIEAALILHI